LNPQNTTNEFSFVLRPSPLQGVGVFAGHSIALGTKLMLLPENYKSRKLKEEDVPEWLRGYCVPGADGMHRCPNEFNHMHTAWFLNHSKSPNARHQEEDNMYYALRDIQAGEEITIDYKTIVDEPGWTASYASE
jgi:SET domain-containing protein